MTALKATKLAEEHNFNIHDTEGFDPCESDRNSCPKNTPLFSFQANKAPGCDKVEVKILKDSSPVIAPIITNLINSFTLSTFPLPRKKAGIVLILKSGDNEEPANTIYGNVKSLNFRILYLIPYPLRLEYRKDPSWARCCLQCM